jgi:FixJ family two-component response regulator
MMTGYGDIPMSVRAVKREAMDILPKPSFPPLPIFNPAVSNG